MINDNDYLCKNKYRAAIYLYYDGAGVVDDYVVYYLTALKNLVSRLIVVCNGALTDAGRERLKDVADTVYCRKNVGFDGWAYKDVLDNVIGWDNVANYDELIITNNTVYGPITPFEEMFDAMEDSPADFWGAQLRYQDLNAAIFLGKPTYHGYIPDFPPSNFWVIRKKAIMSKAFKSFWDELPPLESYEDSCLYCEPVFAQKLRDDGLIMDTYMRQERRFSCQSPTEADTVYQLSEEGIPVLRRKTFFNPLSAYLDCDHADNAVRTMEYIREHTDYNVKMIYDNLCRTANLYDISNRLHLDYIIPERHTAGKETALNIALIFLLKSEDKLRVCKKYIDNLPGGTDVYFIAGSEQIKKAIEESYNSTHLCIKEISVQRDTGFVNTLLINSKEIINCGKYDYILYASDINVPEKIWDRTEESCEERCLGSLLGGEDSIYAILSYMEREKQIGAVSSMPPYCAEYLDTSDGWGESYEDVRLLCESLNIKVSVSPSTPAVYPQYAAMWFRPSALRLMTDFDWSSVMLKRIKDIDGAAMRTVFYTMQQMGYLPTRAISYFNARLDITNLNYILGNICRKAKEKTGAFDSYSLLIQRLSDALDAYNGIEPVILRVNTSETAVLNAAQRLDSDAFNAILDKASAGLLLKKLIKKIVPKRLWSKMRKKHYGKNK